MRIIKLVGFCFSICIGILCVWVLLLFFSYGKQTLFFVVKAPPSVMWTYTKKIFVKSPVGHQTTSTEYAKTEKTADQQLKVQFQVPTKHTIANMSHAYQKMNNCGPTSVSMAASSFGVNFDQFFAADHLKGSDKDKNVSPDELASFIETQGLQAKYRVNGNARIVEELVSQDIPVIVEQWLVKRGSGELVGHYRVVRGYNQQQQIFQTNDSFNGPNFAIPYEQFDEWWRPFNRTYVIVYKQEQEEKVRTILGQDWSEEENWNQSLIVAKNESERVQDGYAFFNLGIAQNKLNMYEDAKLSFDKALTFSFPEHFLWYQFSPLETYAHTDPEKAMKMADDLISHAGEVEEARFFKGVALETLTKPEEAKGEYHKAFSANPRFLRAKEVIERLRLRESQENLAE